MQDGVRQLLHAFTKPDECFRGFAPLTGIHISRVEIRYSQKTRELYWPAISTATTK